jgi:hypothetical protein
MAQNQPSKEVIVAGLKLKVRAAPTTANVAERALFPMEQRSTYGADKLSSLFEAIGKAQKNKFGLLTLALEDQDKLEDTYALQMLLEGTKDHLTQYGVSNVFTIVEYDDADKQNVTSTHNLLANDIESSRQVESVVCDDGGRRIGCVLQAESHSLSHIPDEQHGGRTQAPMC